MVKGETRSKQSTSQAAAVLFETIRGKGLFLQYYRKDHYDLMITDNTITRNIDCEKVHTSYCKYVLNPSKYVSNDACLGERGRTPVYNRVWPMAVSYWLRMAQGTENVLLNDAFACAKIDDNPWLQDIRHLLYKNGFGYADPPAP